MDLCLEDAEHAAMRAQWSGLAAWAPVVRSVGGWSALGCAELPEHPWLNQVAGRGDGLDEALDVLAGVGVVRVATTVAGPPPARLAQRGFAPGAQLLRLAVPARAVPVASPYRLEVVGPERAADVAAVARAGFGLDLDPWWVAPLGRPGWTQVVAYEGDRPVASGGLHVGGRTAWVGAASTVPHARGRGAQRALLRLRLRLAAEQGAERVSVKVEPGSASHRNLEREGFRLAHPVVVWSGRLRSASRRRADRPAPT